MRFFDDTLVAYLFWATLYDKIVMKKKKKEKIWKSKKSAHKSPSKRRLFYYLLQTDYIIVLALYYNPFVIHIMCVTYLGDVSNNARPQSSDMRQRSLCHWLALAS